MANDTYTIGADQYRSDNIGDIQHPVVKIMHGVEGAAVYVSATDPLPTTGTVATSEAKAEDTASANGDRGIPILAVRQDTLASSTSADGDYGFIKADSSGRVYTRVDYMVASDNTTDSISAAIDSSYMMDDNTRITPKHVNGAITAGTGTMVAAVASKSIRVIAATFTSSSSSANWLARNGTGTAVTGTHQSVKGIHMAYNPPGHFQTGTNTALTGSVSTGTLTYTLTYLEV